MVSRALIHAVSTACSTGAHSIGDATRLIINGDADVMIAGGSESPITQIGIAGFNACRALSTKFSDDPISRLGLMIKTGMDL